MRRSRPALAENNQCMAFKPPAFGALFGTDVPCRQWAARVAAGWSGSGGSGPSAVPRITLLGALPRSGGHAMGEVLKSAGPGLVGQETSRASICPNCSPRSPARLASAEPNITHEGPPRA